MTTVKAAFFSLSTTIQMIATSEIRISVSKYWILSIINQTLSKTKELPEIESRYFASEEVFRSLLASRQFIKAVILTDVCRYRFYAIPKLCIIAEFFTLHIPLALCPVWSILWSNECCIPSIDFWTTLPLVWTTNAIIAIKRNLTPPCRFSIALTYRFVPCSTSQKYCSVIIKSEIS